MLLPKTTNRLDGFTTGRRLFEPSSPRRNTGPIPALQQISGRFECNDQKEPSHVLLSIPDNYTPLDKYVHYFTGFSLLGILERKSLSNDIVAPLKGIKQFEGRNE